jgi:predicted unusual protein kinase regulating ubiquinone biosynthesis (AarF/ABC1/UbiB family)
VTSASKSHSNLTRGRARRVLKVGELATSVGSSYVWQALRWPFRSADSRQKALLDTHIRNAMKMVERSKELRGAFMKLVQILSMRDDILPSEALQVLSVVQSSVPPMDYAVIRKQIIRELGGPRRSTKRRLRRLRSARCTRPGCRAGRKWW